MSQHHQAEIAVVGGGVIGWSVALQAQIAFPNSRVTVLSDKPDTATASWVAAGSLRLEEAEEATPGRPERAQRWAEESFRHFAELGSSELSCSSGCFMLPMLQVSEAERQRKPDFLEIVQAAAALTEQELRTQFPEWPQLRSGWSFVTTLADCRRYVPFLRSRATRCRSVTARVGDLQELAARFDLVFNCCGLAAGQLASDTHVFPVRGQVLRVWAPWLKRAVYGPHSTYIYPSSDGSAIVGGVRQADNWNEAPNAIDTADIWSRAVRLVPALADARLMSVSAGLRPARRGGVRVEAEEGGKIVHCYGHGGHGVALSWGSAAEAVSIGVGLLLRGRPAAAKL